MYLTLRTSKGLAPVVTPRNAIGYHLTEDKETNRLTVAFLFLTKEDKGINGLQLLLSLTNKGIPWKPAITRPEYITETNPFRVGEYAFQYRNGCWITETSELAGYMQMASQAGLAGATMPKTLAQKK